MRSERVVVVRVEGGCLDDQIINSYASIVSSASMAASQRVSWRRRRNWVRIWKQGETGFGFGSKEKLGLDLDSKSKPSFSFSVGINWVWFFWFQQLSCKHETCLMVRETCSIYVRKGTNT